MRNLQVAAAVTGALVSAWAAAATTAPPSQPQSNSTVWNLNISGSSAMRDAVRAFISFNFCQMGSFITYSASNTVAGNTVNFFFPNNPDFRAYSCFSNGAPGNPVPFGTVLTIYYRSEWGSVAGVGPIVFPTKTIGRLNLDPTSCFYAAEPDVPNTQNANPHVFPGQVNDQWGSPCITLVPGELGISDEEPTVYVNDNWGIDYPTLNPPPTLTQLQSVNSQQLVGQAFGLIVNTTGLAGFTRPSADMTYTSIANILTGNITDWQKVITTNGVTAANVSTPIKVCNAEPGSGARAAASIYFLGQSGCSSSPQIFDGVKNCVPDSPGHDCFTTSGVLACVEDNNASIGYVSIDNFNRVSAPILPVSIDDADKHTPTNARAATGQYGWYFEAAANKSTNIALNSRQDLLANAIISRMQDINSTAQSTQVLAIPGLTAGNNPAFPLASVGIVPVNIFSHFGNSCTPSQDTIF